MIIMYMHDIMCNDDRAKSILYERRLSSEDSNKKNYHTFYELCLTLYLGVKLYFLQSNKNNDKYRIGFIEYFIFYGLMFRV